MVSGLHGACRCTYFCFVTLVSVTPFSLMLKSTHAHTLTYVYMTHDCSRCYRTTSASLFLAISFCVLLFRTWVRCKILNCTSFLHRFFFFSCFSFPQQEKGSMLWGCKLEHITVFMESEFGCKMFLRFILLDPVQSYS